MVHDDAAPTAREAASPVRRWAVRLGLVVAVSVLAAAVLRAVIGELYLIPSGSMEPTLLPGDRISVDRNAAGGDGVEVGDVVVFDARGSLAPYRSQTALERGVEETLVWWGAAARQDVYVKRVLALGGDTLRCCTQNGALERNGQPVAEPYLGREVSAEDSASSVAFEFEVPAGHMVVLGDHREDSRDSRSLLGAPGGGLIRLDTVIGTAEDIVWPISRRGGVPDVEAEDTEPAQTAPAPTGTGPRP
ncbi:MAG: signal peptidase I [Micrococcus sp.]|nr:signal peptidase I [Micrococcus sp.]